MKLLTNYKLNVPLIAALTTVFSNTSEAAVSVVFVQDGANVVATWTGSIDAGTWNRDVFSFGSLSGSQVGLYSATGPNDVWNNGTFSVTTLNSNPTSASGGAYGFIFSDFLFNGIDDDTAPSSNLVNFGSGTTYQMTWIGRTLSEIGAENFGALGGSGTLAWTSSAGGNNTISYFTSVVPEPSSALLCGVSLIGFFIRRRV